MQTRSHEPVIYCGDRLIYFLETVMVKLREFLKRLFVHSPKPGEVRWSNSGWPIPVGPALKPVPVKVKAKKIAKTKKTNKKTKI